MIPKYLEKEELHLFLETARVHGLDRDYEIFHTLAYTGIRVGELCALMDSAANAKESTIKINKTLYNPNNNSTQYVLNTPKTKSSIREIIVDEEVINNITNLQKYNEMEKAIKKEAYHDHGFIFCKRGQFAGYPEVIKMIQLRMARLLRIAGLSLELTPHSLRHTHTSLCAEAGVSLEQIMERLGHKDDKITKTIYLHITKPKKKEASQKFTELMRGLKNDSNVNKSLTTE
ncbi:site-specific integrase [Paenibacillus sp. FSL H8-0259]|uniref:site-specific integrase n=1 Tax=Paenibacillus TaxID=44249 RepID=UPI000694A800|nr:site-specific integrase [Paenibacillus sp. FSL P4-0081]OMF32718.1 hypothetical protein BK132_00210 [Paenibacillus sp. FSL H8-0259]